MNRRRSKPRYRNQITRLGFHFLFVALFAIIGGSLRGFNLLLMLAGLLNGVVIVQWRQGRNAIRRTRLYRQPVVGAHAGTAMKIRYEVDNVGRWLPIWMIRIEDQVTAACSPRELRPRQGDESTQSVASPSQTLDEFPIPLVGSIGHVPAGCTRGTSIICRFSRRGQYKIGPLVASTTFPFCLMRSDRLSAGSDDKIHVYPRLLDLRRGWKALLPPRRGGDGNRSTGGTNHDGEFFGLRPWQSGDHVKHIHWRTTARIGEPAVRQFEQRNRHQVCVIVDGISPIDDSELGDDFELVLQFAATLLSELAGQTRSVALLMADAMGSDLPELDQLLESRGADLRELQERLAVAQRCVDRETQIDSLARSVAESATRLRHYDVIVISGRSFAQAIDGGLDPSGEKDQATQSQWRHERALALWRFLDQSGRLSWLDVKSPQVRRFLNVDAGKRKATVSNVEAGDVGR